MTQNNLIVIKVKLPISQSCHHTANLPVGQLCRLVLFLKEIQAKPQKWMGTLVSQVKVLDCLRRGAAQAPNLLKPWQLHPRLPPHQHLNFIASWLISVETKQTKTPSLQIWGLKTLSQSGGRQLHLTPMLLEAPATTPMSHVLHVNSSILLHRSWNSWRSLWLCMPQNISILTHLSSYIDN